METSIIKNQIVETNAIKEFNIGNNEYALFKLFQKPFSFLIGQKIPDNADLLEQLGNNSILKTVDNTLYLLVSSKTSFWDCLEDIENLNMSSNTPVNLAKIFDEFYQYPLSKRLDLFSNDGIFSHFQVIFEFGNLIKLFPSAEKMIESLDPYLSKRRDYKIQYGQDCIHIRIADILNADEYTGNMEFDYNSFYNQRNTLLRFYDDIKQIKHLDMQHIDSLLDSIDFILEKAHEDNLFNFPVIEKYQDSDYNNTFGVLNRFVENEFPNMDAKQVQICNDKSEYFNCTGVVLSAASYQGYLCYLVFVTSENAYGVVEYLFEQDLKEIDNQ